MTLLEAISPTARKLLKSGGGGIPVRTICKNISIRHKVHAPVVDAGDVRPLCGGGNGGTEVQWQETMLPVNCERCLEILNPTPKPIDYQI